MSTLLTYNEYSVIAKNLTFSVNPFVNGKFSKPLSGNTMETINPATGDVLATVAAVRHCTPLEGCSPVRPFEFMHLVA